MLSKLNPIFPLTPKPFIFCSDESVIGAPFYVMQRVKGITIDHEPGSTSHLTLSDKKQIT